MVSRGLKYLFVSVFVCIVAWQVFKPVKQNYDPPPWRNFGTLNDAEAQTKSDKQPVKFRVSFTESDVQMFRGKLRNARFPHSIDKSVNMTYGYPSSALPALRDDLLKLDWDDWANTLNQYDQFKMNIMGLDIHYVHIRGKPGLQIIPLLMVHGWPGSFYEFYDSIPLLQKYAEENGFTYDIVLPSLPGFGFSEPSSIPGCSAQYVAAMYNELMVRLSYKMYLCQGGDFGSLIVEWLAALYPDNLIGQHVNMFTPPNGLFVHLYMVAAYYAPSYFLTPEEAAIMSTKSGPFNSFVWMLAEGGYIHIQATKPDTVGTALTDSPLGLAAYILEKFYTWTNKNTIDVPIDKANKLLPYDIKKALYNVLIYWHSNSILTSVRFYKDSRMLQDAVDGVLPIDKINVPSGALMTQHEIMFFPKYIVNMKYPNLTLYTALPKGGHFAAFEIPDEFSKEVVKFTLTLF